MAGYERVSCYYYLTERPVRGRFKRRMHSGDYSPIEGVPAKPTPGAYQKVADRINQVYKGKYRPRHT